jgi:hypothetical protein
MTSQHPIMQALAHVSFAPGTASKRFVRQMASKPADYEYSERATAYVWRIAYIFRRQLPKELAIEAVARKVSHVPEITAESSTPRCAVCGYFLTARELNAPCAGPPQSKRDKPREKCNRTRGAVPAVESSIVAPHESQLLLTNRDEKAPIL